MKTRRDDARGAPAILDLGTEELSFVLRLWRSEGEGPEPAAWRGSLLRPDTGERIGFADLEALCAFLRAQTEGRGGA